MTKKTARLTAALLVVAAALLASAALAASARSYVLQLSDLAPGFKVEKTKVLTNEATAADGSVTVAQLRKWGRITGYEADYSLSAAGPKTRGAIAVGSKANLYRDAAGASTAWNASLAYAKAHLGSIGGKALRIRPVGDESWGFSYAGSSGGLKFTYYLYTWRIGARSAALIAGGLKGRIAQRDAEALVAKQAARMKG